MKASTCAKMLDASKFQPRCNIPAACCCCCCCCCCCNCRMGTWPFVLDDVDSLVTTASTAVVGAESVAGAVGAGGGAAAAAYKDFQLAQAFSELCSARVLRSIEPTNTSS